MTERENALNILNRAMPPLRNIEDLYQEITDKPKTLARKVLKGIYIYLIVVHSVVVGISIAGIVVGGWKIQKYSLGYNSFINLAILIGLGVIIRKAKKKKEEKRKAVEQQIQQIFQENYEVIKPLPRDYRYYQAADYLEQVLANGRADNMKDALNLFENHLHQQRVENYNRAALEQNEQIARQLRKIESSTSFLEWTTILR